MLDEPFDNVVGVMAVTQQVLATQEHLERGFGRFFLEQADAFPRVLVEETDAGVKSRSPPHLQGEKPHLVQFLGDGEHVFGFHPSGEQGLVRVTQDDVRNLQRIRVCHLTSLRGWKRPCWVPDGPKNLGLAGRHGAPGRLPVSLDWETPLNINT